MNQIFAEKLAEAGWDKNKLIELMAEIDQEKRSIKTALRRIAQDPEYSMEGQCRKRHEKDRRLKDKERYLKEERETVQHRIGRINREAKAMKRATNKGSNFAAAFFAAAEEIVNPELFSELEQRAAEIVGQA